MKKDAENVTANEQRKQFKKSKLVKQDERKRHTKKKARKRQK